MSKLIPQKIQGLVWPAKFLLVLGLHLYCQNIWALQDAIVVVDRGVIYTDEKMSSAIGFARKGKKVKIGDNPRNQGQVYPVIVSGRIGFIKVEDVSSERESPDAEILVSERFLKNAGPKYKSNVSVSALMYSTQISLNAQNDSIADGDAVNWMGFSLKGGLQTAKILDVEFLINYLSADNSGETFKVIETGLGAGVRFIETQRFMAKIYLQALAAPYASYALDDLFRMNGSGYSFGAGVSLTYRLGLHWGLEAYGGLHYMKLMGIEPPSPYKSIEPSFAGNRIGVGAIYQF